MASNSSSEYKVVADKIVSPDEDIIIKVRGAMYKDSIEEANRYATISEVGEGGGSSVDIADFTFTNNGDDPNDVANSTISLHNKDMTLETTRDVNEEDPIDADINIDAADDVFITANGDDIVLQAARDVRIESNGEGFEWEFTSTGIFSFPHTGQILNPSNTSGDGLGLSTFEIVPDSTNDDDRYIVIDPTTPNHIHIRAGGNIDNSTAELILGGEDTNVIVSDTSNTVIITSTAGQFLDSNSAGNQIATLGDIGAETAFAVVGGSGGTAPTFTGDPLFSGTYVRMSSDLVHFQIQVDFDNITSFGTGQYYVDLPFPAKYGYKFREGCLHDISATRDYEIGGHVAAGETRLYLSTTDTQSGSVFDIPFTSSAPIALNVADNFHVSGTYIADPEAP